MKSIRQFIYVLKLVPRLTRPENWTSEEEQIVGQHVLMLEGLLAEGRLILAGKTSGLNQDTFGIVIFEAEDEAEARLVMESDPAVSGGIMNAELFPYQVAFRR